MGEGGFSFKLVSHGPAGASPNGDLYSLMFKYPNVATTAALAHCSRRARALYLLRSRSIGGALAHMIAPQAKVKQKTSAPLA